MVKPNSAAADEKILSYEDVVLRRSDLDILIGPEFLNDRIIEFYFSYLTTNDPSKSKLFVAPAITYWIANCPDTQSLLDVLQPLNFPSYSIIVFAVNNNDDVSRAEGGSHWSLLAFYKKNGVFLHHDSSGKLNHAHAYKLFSRVSRLVDPSGRFGFIEADTPQQVNGFDCGVYVAAIAKVIYEWNGESEKAVIVAPWASEVKKRVTPANVASMRGELLQLIKSMI